MLKYKQLDAKAREIYQKVSQFKLKILNKMRRKTHIKRESIIYNSWLKRE